MGNEISQEGVGGKRRPSNSGYDPGDMPERRGGYHQRACIERPIHLFVSIPPQVTIDRLVQRLKGKISFKLQNEFPHLRRTYGCRHFGVRGYFCCNSGNVTDELIMKYIRKLGGNLRQQF